MRRQAHCGGRNRIAHRLHFIFGRAESVSMKYKHWPPRRLRMTMVITAVVGHIDASRLLAAKATAALTHSMFSRDAERNGAYYLLISYRRGGTGEVLKMRRYRNERFDEALATAGSRCLALLGLPGQKIIVL